MTNKVHPTVGSAPTDNDDVAFRAPIKHAPPTTDSYHEDVDMEELRRQRVPTGGGFSDGAAHECQEYWVMWLILLIIGFLLGFFLGALLESTALHMFNSTCSTSGMFEMYLKHTYCIHFAACDCTRNTRVAAAGIGGTGGETPTDSPEDPASINSSTSVRGKSIVTCPYDAELLRNAGEKDVHPHSLSIQG